VKKGLLLTLLLVMAGAAVWFLRQLLRTPGLPPKPRTVEQVREALRPVMEPRLRERFERAGVDFPPERLVLVGLKGEKMLEVYGAGRDGVVRLVTSYPILGASGAAGPKLREGDKQVPEGFYRIELLNPNSSYHLSLRVNYPNDDDIAQAKDEGRDLSNLGGDIMIHGGVGSSGCLAMGDPPVEEIFYLVDRAGLDRTKLVIVPWDFRARGMNGEVPESAPVWTGALHERLRKALAEYPR